MFGQQFFLGIAKNPGPSCVHSAESIIETGNRKKVEGLIKVTIAFRLSYGEGAGKAAYLVVRINVETRRTAHLSDIPGFIFEPCKILYLPPYDTIRKQIGRA